MTKAVFYRFSRRIYRYVPLSVRKSQADEMLLWAGLSSLNTSQLTPKSALSLTVAT